MEAVEASHIYIYTNLHLFLFISLCLSALACGHVCMHAHTCDISFLLSCVAFKIMCRSVCVSISLVCLSSVCVSLSRLICSQRDAHTGNVLFFFLCVSVCVSLYFSSLICSRRDARSRAREIGEREHERACALAHTHQHTHTFKNTWSSVSAGTNDTWIVDTFSCTPSPRGDGFPVSMTQDPTCSSSEEPLKNMGRKSKCDSETALFTCIAGVRWSVCVCARASVSVTVSVSVCVQPREKVATGVRPRNAEPSAPCDFK